MKPSSPPVVANGTRTLTFAFLGLYLVPMVAMAEPIEANRPGQADPPTVLAPGVSHIEGGFTIEHEADDDPETDTLTLPGVELRFGLRERLELQIAADGFVQEWRDGEDNRNGGSDMEVDLRIAVTEQSGWRPALAIDFGVSLPTGAGFVTSDGYDPELELLWAWDIAQRWNLNGNFDFASESQGEDDSSRNSIFRPQLALGLTVNDRLGTFIEYYGVIEDGAGNQHSLDTGFTWLASDDMQFDISAGAGLNDEAPDFFLSMGIALRFGSTSRR